MELFIARRGSRRRCLESEASPPNRGGARGFPWALRYPSLSGIFLGLSRSQGRRQQPAGFCNSFLSLCRSPAIDMGVGPRKFGAEIRRNRRALDVINQNVGAQPYPCVVNKRSMNEDCVIYDENLANNPLTRRLAAQISSKQQPPQEVNCHL